MRDILTVMEFTIKDMVKRKSFIISTIIILLLIVLGFNIPNLLKLIDNTDYKSNILIIDKDNLFEDNIKLLNDYQLDYNFMYDNKDINDVKKLIDNKDIDSAIFIYKDNDLINIDYYVDSIGIDTMIPDDVVNSISTLYTNLQISKLGLSIEELNSINPNFNVDIKQTSEGVNSDINILTMMIICIILFYAIYFCAFQVSSAITTEKTSKIMETLVTSTKPSIIVLGKTLGIGLVGLLQLLTIILTAFISAKLFIDQELLDVILNISNITITSSIVTIVYFLLGYFIYALLYALTGSTVSKPEDVQSANVPISLLAVVCFYISYITMMNPSSKLNVIASIFPFTSPFCMPTRVMMGLASITDVLISLGILLLTILLIAKLAIKIYSNAIINYGTKLSLKDIINMYKEK